MSQSPQPKSLFAQALDEAIEESGRSAYEVARESGVDPGRLSRLRRGLNAAPSDPDVVRRLALAARADPERLQMLAALEHVPRPLVDALTNVLQPLSNSLRTVAAHLPDAFRVEVEELNRGLATLAYYLRLPLLYELGDEWLVEMEPEPTDRLISRLADRIGVPPASMQAAVEALRLAAGRPAVKGGE